MTTTTRTTAATTTSQRPHEKTARLIAAYIAYGLDLVRTKWKTDGNTLPDWFTTIEQLFETWGKSAHDELPERTERTSPAVQRRAYDVMEVAAAWGVHDSTVKRALRSKKKPLRSFKAGDRRLISLQALEEYEGHQPRGGEAHDGAPLADQHDTDAPSAA